ncbi:MAG: phosphate ABC transporter permease PstA [Actinomycetota bacterium]
MAVVASGATREAVARSLRGRGRDWAGTLFHGALLGSLALTLGVLVTLLADIARRGIPVLAERGLSFFSVGYSTIPSRAGVGQALIGSAFLMGTVIVVAFPIGIAAAIYLEEYAPDTRLTRLLNANIRNLAGVPSIVYGLLGLSLFVKALGPLTGGPTMIAGGLTLAILVIPIVIITTAEALRAVPDSIREAGFGVGATRWEVIRSHVLPYAAPGVLTGVILSLARAFGETAPLILAGAKLGFFASGSGGLASQLTGPYTSLPTVAFLFSRQPNPDFQALAGAAALVLLGVLLALNSVAIALRNRYERGR